MCQVSEPPAFLLEGERDAWEPRSLSEKQSKLAELLLADDIMETLLRRPGGADLSAVWGNLALR